VPLASWIANEGIDHLSIPAQPIERGARGGEAGVRAGIRNVSCDFYEGARHEVLNERNRNEALATCWPGLPADCKSE
jgi:hypothetical protein